MRLFKKLFSIGSKKSKKRSAVDACTETLPPVHQHLEPPNADRTEAETDLGSLPPLPHPIDSIIPPPKSSSTTIASVSARSTYSVTIRSRTVHSRTEFPNAYPPMDLSFTPKRSLTLPDSARRRSKSVPITPRDNSRLLLLRQDPSVASLLNHYDDQGHLNSALFSNTPSPQKEGRIQRRRTGSTLRQLLGQPSSQQLRNSVEGDISWAEKFLGETDCNSSVSSIGPRTPIDTHFTHTRSIDDQAALSIECDTSAANHPTFSSLEVELSVSADHAHPQAIDSPKGNATTPQRASQIFGFLGDKKRAHEGPVSRLPQLKTTTPAYRRFSAESSISDARYSQIPLPRRSNTYTFLPTSPTSQRRLSFASDMSKSPLSPTAAFLLPQSDDETSDFAPAVVSPHTEQSSHGLRRPRVPSRTLVDDSRSVTNRLVSVQSISSEKSDSEDKHIVAIARPRDTHSQIPKLRTASGSSSSSTEPKHDPAINSLCQYFVPLQSTVQKQCRSTEAGPSSTMSHGDAPSRLPQPITPIRPFVLPHHLQEPPSPASSSELSPVAKEMMAGLRQQRMYARQRERQSGRLGSSQSRIRY